MQSLRIAVAGPYSAATPIQRRRNLDLMNAAAAELMRRGHVPIIGVNAALPVVDRLFADPEDGPSPPGRNDAIMAISMAVIENCDAILHLAPSPGADRERDHLAARGKLVYRSLAEVPPARSGA
ncbi:MAG: DUF4406 domain-containing protein [Phycisphaerae bacterium]|nr:DUF4406 domain-containing protein [Phycisphaerae bacterium]